MTDWIDRYLDFLRNVRRRPTATVDRVGRELREFSRWLSIERCEVIMSEPAVSRGTSQTSGKSQT